MLFEYFNNFFNATASAATTKKTSLNNKTTICPRKVNIYHSNDKAGARNKKSCCYLTSARNKNQTTFFTATASRSSTRLYPLKLKRKIRKTSRRKRKRKFNGCLQNKTTVNMVNNLHTVTTSTATLLQHPVLASATNTVFNTHKCKISVNNRRKLNLKTNHKYHKLNFCSKSVRNICRCGINKTTNKISSCDSNYCKYDCNCSCSCSRQNLSSKIQNRVVSLLLPQTTFVNKVTNLAHESLTDKQYFINNAIQKRDQLSLKHEKLQQLKNLYALRKQKQILPNRFTTTTTFNTSFLPPTSASVSATAVATTLLSTASSSPSDRSLCFPGTFNSFSTCLTNCKLPTTAKTTTSAITPTPTSTTTKNLTRFYSRSSLPAAASLYTTWHRVTCLAPARILNELFGVIFMTLLVLSICHNNVLETSAASIKVTRRDVASSVLAVEQIKMPNKNSIATSRLTERQYKKQHPPEHSTQQYYQKLTQTNNNYHHHHHQQQQYQELQQSYLNHKDIKHQPLELDMEEDKSNHIFQPQLETWPKYKQHERDPKQHQPQHLTTQTTLLSHSGELEMSYNNTFQSLSIIDGDLTVGVDANQNRMTVEEELLIAASGGAVGVGSSGIGLGNHLHNGNNDLGSFDTGVMGSYGFNAATHHGETNSMPIFDFGMPRNTTARTGHTEAVIKCRVDRLDDKSVSWIRKRDLHILTVGTATYTSDKRFQVTESKDSREWTLHVKSPQARDSGIYECQVNTEPKMSMAFQLNVIDISPDAKAVITGPADLHFKVGSAIILTCIIHQPSVKDIGPIYWYRGEYMITPFDINESTQEESAVFSLAAVTPSQTLHNQVNVLEQNHHYHQQTTDGSYGGGSAVGLDTEQVPQILTNEITQDFAQRIAMESQLGDTMKSRLRISNAQTSDTGNYTCQPTTASSASVMVHVINDENPAAMQKSEAYNVLYRNKKALISLHFAIIIAATATYSVYF